MAVVDKCMFEFPRDVVNLSYFAIPLIDLYYKGEEDSKGDDLLALMIDDYLIEYKYLSEFDKGSGLKQNFNICGQVLGSLTRVLQIHQPNDQTYSYIKEEDKYYKMKDDNVKEEINYSTFRINTFLDEYYALQ